MADNAFAQMTNLKELNLADNQLAALPPTLFTTQMNSLESLQVSAGTAVVKTFDVWNCDTEGSRLMLLLGPAKSCICQKSH